MGWLMTKGVSPKRDAHEGGGMPVAPAADPQAYPVEARRRAAELRSRFPRMSYSAIAEATGLPTGLLTEWLIPPRGLAPLAGRRPS